MIEVVSLGSHLARVSRPVSNLTDFCAGDSTRPGEMDVKMRIEEILTMAAASGTVDDADHTLGLRVHFLVKTWIRGSGGPVEVTLEAGSSAAQTKTVSISKLDKRDSPVSIGDVEIIHKDRAISPGEIFRIPVR